MDITVSLTGPDGTPVTDLTQLRKDTSYAVSVTVSPKTEPQADSSGTPASEQAGSATGKVNVFKPTLAYEDGTVYYGDTFDRATLPGYCTSTRWFHGTTEDTTVSMTGTAPELSYGYDTARPTDIVDTKQDIPVCPRHQLTTQSPPSRYPSSCLYAPITFEMERATLGFSAITRYFMYPPACLKKAGTVRIRPSLHH